jgi:hypothetical protein
METTLQMFVCLLFVTIMDLPPLQLQLVSNGAPPKTAALKSSSTKVKEPSAWHNESLVGAEV